MSGQEVTANNINGYISAIADTLGNSPIRLEGHPLLEPLPGVAPAEKGSIRTYIRGLLEAFDLQ